jgi:hypothetical protein
MNYVLQLLFCFILNVICTPPPNPLPSYNVFALEPTLQREITHTNESSSLKRLSEAKQFVENNKVKIEIIDDGVYEEHELKISTKDLPDGYVYTSYSQSLTLSEGQILIIVSNTCQKFNNTGEEAIDSECNSSLVQNDNNYQFLYKYRLRNYEYIIIKFTYNITKTTKEILYRQEYIRVPQIYPDGFCNYAFIIPEKYKNLGLKYGLFQKKSDYIYFYEDNCPNEQIIDIIRLAPKVGYWKADVNLNLKSSSISKNIKLTFPRLYRGGKNRNKNYKITIENEIIKESNIIKDQTFLYVQLINKNSLDINLHTAFSNNLDEEFVFYPSENLLELDENIDEAIKSKAQEIINDPNSQYKDYPDYYKIGKFVNSHIEYDLTFLGHKLTSLEIFQQKKGVCEHYTILYNAMLNAIGIKTIKIFGWAFDKDTVSGDENTVGHAWTGALINNKFMELDATWDLFEGIPAGHILKGFGQEVYSYINVIDYKITQNIQLVENLNDEEEDKTTDEEEKENSETKEKEEEKENDEKKEKEKKNDEDTESNVEENLNDKLRNKTINVAENDNNIANNINISVLFNIIFLFLFL